MGVISYFKSRKEKQNFKTTYEKYYGVIFKRISYLTQDVHIAEDLTQEVFIKLYNSPPNHDNTLAWLNTVSANLSYNYLRDRKKHEEKSNVIYENEVDNIVLIEELAISNCEVELTRKVLDTLSARDRMCLLLKFSGYKYNEISEVIGVDKNSIGTILARAQAKFKENYLKLEKRGDY